MQSLLIQMKYNTHHTLSKSRRLDGPTAKRWVLGSPDRGSLGAKREFGETGFGEKGFDEVTMNRNVAQH